MTSIQMLHSNTNCFSSNESLGEEQILRQTGPGLVVDKVVYINCLRNHFSFLVSVVSTAPTITAAMSSRNIV